MDLNFLLTANSLTNLEFFFRIFAALLVGGIIGLEREYKNRPAGMRTHVLVCLGACSVALLECLLSSDPTLSISAIDKTTYTLGRLSAQVISGIGFLGAGTIFMAQKKISGLTTAASVWNVACLGLLVGFGYTWMGLFIGTLITIVLLFLGRVIKINAIKHVEVKFINRAATLPFINTYFESLGVLILDIDFHVEAITDINQQERNLYTNVYTLHLPKKVEYVNIVGHLSEYNNIQTVRTRNA